MTVSVFPRIINLACLALFVVLTVCVTSPCAYAVTANGANAIDILGQFDSQTSDASPNYTKSDLNSGPSAFGFYTHLGFAQDYAGIAIDGTNHLLFAADWINNRVLVFQLDSGNHISSKTPIHVLGQTNFNSSAGGVTQSTLNQPQGLAVDPTNHRLYVADMDACRVMVFNTNSISDGMNATYVLGATDFNGSDSCGTSQSTFYGPIDVAFDGVHNRLFVSMWTEARVLVFNTAAISNGMNASYVLGQSDFTSSNWDTTQSNFRLPIGLAYDSAHDVLYVADNQNSRVLQFDVAPGSIANGENASHVIGHADFNTSNGNTNQWGLAGPRGLALDVSGNRLFVADSGNSRVMMFDTSTVTDGMNATHVIGQEEANGFDNYQSDYVSNTHLFNGAYGIAYDSTNKQVYVGDAASRIMVFDAENVVKNAVDLIGQYTSPSSPATIDWNKAAINNGPNALGLNGPQGIALDRVHHRLFVSDPGNQRVLVYNLNTDNSLTDHIADHVLGQPTMTAGNDWYENEYGTDSASQISPRGLAYDPVNDRLFVADYWNRILVFNTSSITDGMNASYAIGQSNLYSRNEGASQTMLREPQGLYLDVTNNRLFVIDSGNNRVLVFDTSSISNGMSASYVLGQINFTNRGGGSYSTGLNWPTAVALDAVKNRLFVADCDNNRVLEFSVATITNGMAATHVLGQTGYGGAHRGAGRTQSTMSCPDGLAFDSNTGRLFVGEWNNDRVLVFNTNMISNGMNASYVLGKSNFTDNNSNTSQSAIGHVNDGMYYDMGSGRLFVPDYSNNRVMIFDGTAAMADWQLP